MTQGPSLNILVTGAAGLIGSELCGQLAERGHGVIALLHHVPVLERNDGSTVVPRRYCGLGVEPGTILGLAGDIRKPTIGLDAEMASALASHVEIIVHCAAETRFTAGQHRGVNVDGTANVLAFARAAARLTGVLHVSTAYVSGERSGPIAEDERLVNPSFGNPYEASKAEAEVLAHLSGLPVAIARPSIVVGTSNTGAIGRFKNIYPVLRLIGSGRIRVLPATPGATLDLVPIDHVIGGLVDIIEQLPAAAGRTFHLVSGDPVPLETMVALDCPGFEVPRLVQPEAFDPSQLDAEEAWLHQSLISLYAAYLRRDPRFAAANLRALSGRVCPQTGPVFLRKLVDYATEAGYLQPNGAAEGDRAGHLMSG